MITIQGLKKSFNGTPVLRGVDIEVRDSETLVIIGASGGGKSVFLKHLCGLIKPDEGCVTVDEVNIEPLSEEELIPIRKKFGVLFQGAALFDSMTVFDNVAFPLREERRFSEAEIDAKVTRSLGIVDLAKARDKMPSELSGGMRKRVGLARACVTEPKYILYDEPTTGLDPIRADNINHLIIRLHDELKVSGVAVTHDMVSAYKIADRIALLHQGRIHTVGTPQEIQDNPDPIVRNFITGAGDIQHEVELGATSLP